MKRFYMTKGLPASGKTTWARGMQDTDPAIVRVNKDDLREMLHYSRHSKLNEKQVLRVRDFVVTDSLANGRSVIVDDTNLAPHHEAHLREIAKAYGVEFVVKDFTDVPLDVAITRNADRLDKEPVPTKVIREMYSSFVAPTLAKPTYDPFLPHAVICDIDGTLAHRAPLSRVGHPDDGTTRSPFDWHRVGEDRVDPVVLDYLGSVMERDALLFVSGRDEVCREETAKWLAKHNLNGNLYMRPAGDNRKDSIVKREIFEKHIKDNFFVTVVLDDRNQVVRMWRDELGLKVWQVADGDF